MKRQLAVVAALAIAACIQEPPVVMSRVAMKVIGPSGAVSYVEIDTLGRRVSGSISGDVTPQVHNQADSVSPSTARRLFAEARALNDSLLRHEGRAPAEPRGSAVIAIQYSDESESRIVWPVTTPPDDPKLRTLIADLTAQKPGGW